MEFIINEYQLKLISEGISSPRFGESVRRMQSFVSRVVSKVEKKYGINLTLLSTWGPAVGGFVLPLNNFIKSGSFSLNETQSFLVLAGVAATIFFDNKTDIKKIVKKIKDEGILDTFEIIVEKAKDLKYSFSRFIESLGTSINSVSDIVSYSFLIPIITDIQDYFGDKADISKTAEFITKRLLASGAVMVTAVLLTELLKKIGERLSKKDSEEL